VYLSRLARVRVLAVQENTATAAIVAACSAVHRGDVLVPYQATPIPMIERVYLRDLANDFSGRLNGSVLFTVDPRGSIAGAGDLVGINLGSGSGLTSGDRILFWRPGESASPRRVLAQGVVLFTTPAGSTVKVLESTSEIRAGDGAEAL
jgi:hypothetical protein